MDNSKGCGTCKWAGSGVCILGCGEITTNFICFDYEPEDDNK